MENDYVEQIDKLMPKLEGKLDDFPYKRIENSLKIYKAIRNGSAGVILNEAIENALKFFLKPGVKITEQGTECDNILLQACNLSKKLYSPEDWEKYYNEKDTFELEF